MIFVDVAVALSVDVAAAAGAGAAIVAISDDFSTAIAWSDLSYLGTCVRTKCDFDLGTFVSIASRRALQVDCCLFGCLFVCLLASWLFTCLLILAASCCCQVTFVH